jgi:hypothetical protein
VKELPLLQVSRRDRHHVIPVANLALLVDADAAIGVAVQGEAHVGLPAGDEAGQSARVGRPAVQVYVPPVRLDADSLHCGAEPAKGLGAHAVRSPVGAVERDPESIEARAGTGAEVFDVPFLDVPHCGRLADLFPLAGHQQALEFGLDRLFGIVGQLDAPGSEKLDPVVHEGVVGGRDDDADVGVEVFREKRDRGRRHDARQYHVGALREHAGDQGGLEHHPRDPRVPADNDSAAPSAERPDSRPAQAQRQLGSEVAVGLAAYTVCTEVSLQCSSGRPRCRQYTTTKKT